MPSRRCASTVASISCSTAPGWRSATSCRTSRRPSTTSSSTSRQTAGSTCCAPCDGVDVQTAVAFSSIAGRFGNGGQTDYSAANDLLCKSISNLRRTGTTRGIAIDWTAWAEIGMATRGSIPKMMEMAGIDMLPPAIGVPGVRHEVEAAGAGGEVVVGGVARRAWPRSATPPAGSTPMPQRSGSRRRTAR